jgi:protein gp37
VGGTTGIDWTDATWNPLTWRCTKVSGECDHCYAETLTNRWHGPGAFTSEPPSLKPGRLLLPWNDPDLRGAYRIFLTSMSDPFHKGITYDEMTLMWAAMAAAHDHVHQVLTKRDGVMRARLNSPQFANKTYWQLDRLEHMARNARRLTPWRTKMIADIDLARRTWTWPLRNVWAGVSVGLQKTADRRVQRLTETMAATRFLSCEPLLEHVDLTEWIAYDREVTDPDMDAPDGAIVDGMRRSGDWWIREEHLIHLVIAGGESGGSYRPLDLDAARSLRDQCRDGYVPFWFKQIGGLTPKAGGDLLDGRQWKQLPVPRPGVLV